MILPILLVIDVGIARWTINCSRRSICCMLLMCVWIMVMVLTIWIVVVSLIMCFVVVSGRRIWVMSMLWYTDITWLSLIVRICAVGVVLEVSIEIIISSLSPACSRSTQSYGYKLHCLFHFVLLSEFIPRLNTLKFKFLTAFQFLNPSLVRILSFESL